MFKSTLPFLCTLFLPLFAHGAIADFHLDPSRSVLHLRGTYRGHPMSNQIVHFDPQGNITFVAGGFPGDPGKTSPLPDSLATAWTGTFRLDRDANSLRITAGAIAAQNNGRYVGLPTGTAHAGNYGLSVSSMSSPGFNVWGALRDLSFSLGTPTLSGASFDTRNVALSGIAGTLDYSSHAFANTVPTYNYPPTYYSVPLPDSLTLAGGTAALTTRDGVDTFTLPFDTQFTVMVNNSPLTLHLFGSLVATDRPAALPEPGTLAFAGMACALPLLRRRRPRCV